MKSNKKEMVTTVLNIPKEQFLSLVAEAVAGQVKARSVPVKSASKSEAKSTKKTAKAKKAPLDEKTKKERLEQLREAREAWFKKKGYGAYAKAS